MPELGQLVFGGGAGEVSIPRGGVLSDGIHWLNDHLTERQRFGGNHVDAPEGENPRFENDVFLWREESWDGNPNPNFVYKPTAYKIWWYKYPLRGATATDELPDIEVLRMIDSCIESLEVE